MGKKFFIFSVFVFFILHAIFSSAYAEKKFLEDDVDILLPDNANIFKDFERVAEEDLDILFDDIDETEDVEKEEPKAKFFIEEVDEFGDIDSDLTEGIDLNLRF